MEFNYSEDLDKEKHFCKLAWIKGKIVNEPSSGSIDTLLQNWGNEQPILSPAEIRALPIIQATRLGFKSFGKDPNRYRPSAEALLKRFYGGKPLYQINQLVDFINFLSITTNYSIGGYDLKNLSGTPELGIGKQIDDYQAIGRGSLNIAGLPVLRDTIGPFGSPCSDSIRTSISLETSSFLLVYFVFSEDSKIEETLEKSVTLLKQHLRILEIEQGFY